MNCLFIGGPKDGKWDEVEMRQYIRTFKLPKWEIAREMKMPSPMDQNAEEFIYRAETLMAGEDRHHIYVLDSMSIQDAMKVLLANYKP